MTILGGAYMILSLYIMTICLCAYVGMMGYDMEKARLIVLFVGIAFFWIANCCYNNTISTLKAEIKELRKQINFDRETSHD